VKHLVLMPLYPPARYGGVEIIAERLCAAMAETDDVVVFAVNPQRSTVGHRRFGSLEVWEVPGHVLTPLGTDNANAVILEVARTHGNEVDVIHCHDWFLADAACTLASRGTPLIGYFHTVKELERHHLGETRTAARRYSEEKQALLAERADVVAVYSDYMRASVSGTFGLPANDIVQFRCGPTLPVSGEEPVLRGSSRLRISFIGRLAVEKGVDHLLRAFLELQRHGDEYSLRILGAGPIASDLMAQAAQEPSASIEFQPFTTDPATLVDTYLDSDLVVVPSRFEPYGLVAAEALTLGVPVAVAATGGLPEIMSGGRFGAVFAADDVDELCQILATAGSNQAENRVRAALGRDAHADPMLWHDAAAQVLARATGLTKAAVR
jgi:glycogen(starch) synthase